MSLETPLHRVEGLGSAHSGVKHFWRERVTAAALVPLSLWFVVSVVGLLGATKAETLSFFQHPVNAVLMAAFVLVSLYHMALGLQVVIDDYLHGPGMRLFSLLCVRVAAFVLAAASIYALFRIAGP